MITNKRGRSVQSIAISSGGLRFAPPVAVKPKRNVVKQKAGDEAVVSVPAAQPGAVVALEIAVAPEDAVTPKIAVTQLVDAAAEPVGGDQARAAQKERR